MQPLLDLLMARRGLGVTDARDIIYGHLGMVKQSMNDWISIDYNMTLPHLYETVALLLIRSHRLKVLEYIEALDFHLRDDSIPSWSPDVSPHLFV
jgi:hypothetical protein